jgi:hypothetical protein
MLSSTFEDKDPARETSAGKTDYTFDGYVVEFSDKVALTPITLPGPPTRT